MALTIRDWTGLESPFYKARRAPVREGFPCSPSTSATICEYVTARIVRAVGIKWLESYTALSGRFCATTCVRPVIPTK